MVGILSGHRILVTGVLTDDSLAYGIAQRSIEEGAEILLSGAGRGMSLTRRMAKRLGVTTDVIALDVTDEAEVAESVNAVEAEFGRLDGLVHAIGYAPESALGHGMLKTPFADVATAFHISTYSLATLVGAFRPLLQRSTAHGGASVIGLDFDATRAYPMYDWMGVAKAGLESLSRYIAKEVGPDHIRVNLLAAGPIRTMAARSIPGFAQFEDSWSDRAPLGWDVRDASAVHDTAVAMLSPLMRGTTASIVYVDGGAHAMG
ncbi:MAG: enoyl-ACP reductase FabI [Actinobacteria bacterium]|nr:enoyl-ACP reductase FabI [Actinomycetota bacterium]MUH57763.1 enoyl-ACP reductase FabI [Actinomycetota bacterium]